MSSSMTSNVSSITFQDPVDFSTFEHRGTGLPQEMEVYNRPNGNLEIKPIEGGGVGYGIGRAMRMSFDFFYPKMTGLFQWVVKNLPQPAFFNIRGASASDVPRREETHPTFQNREVDRKRLVQLGRVYRSCDKVNVLGNCTIPGGFPLTLSSSTNISCIAAGEHGVQIVDTRYASSPRVVGSFNKTIGEALDVSLFGDHVFVAYGSSGLQILNISNPSRPYTIGFFNNLQGIAKKVKIQGNYAYVGCSKDSMSSLNKIFIIDVKNLSSPKLIGSYESPFANNMIFDYSISGNYAFLCVSAYEAGILVLDVSNPSNPAYVSFFNTVLFNPNGIAINPDDPNWVYVTATWPFLQVHAINISNPNKLTLGGALLYDIAMEQISLPIVCDNLVFLICPNSPPFPPLSFTLPPPPAFPYTTKQDLCIVDVSNPLDLKEIGSYFIGDGSINNISVTKGDEEWQLPNVYLVAKNDDGKTRFIDGEIWPCVKRS